MPATGTPAASIAFRAPTCATPRAAPPPSATPTPQAADMRPMLAPASAPAARAQREKTRPGRALPRVPGAGRDGGRCYTAGGDVGPLPARQAFHLRPGRGAGARQGRARLGRGALHDRPRLPLLGPARRGQDD